MASNQWSTYTQYHTHTRVYIVTNKFKKILGLRPHHRETEVPVR